MGHNNATLKNQNSLMKLKREIADGLHEGEHQCPPTPQSVTDLHSEGRPSDRRHWARRCLNHFWVSSSERPASAAIRHSVVGSGCLLTLLKLYSRISTWSSVGPLAVSVDMVPARLLSPPRSRLFSPVRTLCRVAPVSGRLCFPGERFRTP